MPILQQLLSTLCDELTIPLPPLPPAEQEITLQFTSAFSLRLRELAPGLLLRANIASCPLEGREELFIHLMQANFLAQATGGSKIGLDTEEKFLTLSFDVPYEMSYRTFKETLELFLNHLGYWRKEIEKLES